MTAKAEEKNIRC